ncbi:hypothetical protein DBV15_03126 [Temnothorax longispinosus]|uniref:Uncharacterized protein n=1 Tax=Temnothorax longispinosus TaxID=300112 RepID=A0A4S2KT93_9HYME|nr:hypothetical protein DBV15_03126 [Temnothorax longispinosus]
MRERDLVSRLVTATLSDGNGLSSFDVFEPGFTVESYVIYSLSHSFVRSFVRRIYEAKEYPALNSRGMADAKLRARTRNAKKKRKETTNTEKEGNCGSWRCVKKIPLRGESTSQRASRMRDCWMQQWRGETSGLKLLVQPHYRCNGTTCAAMPQRYTKCNADRQLVEQRSVTLRSDASANRPRCVSRRSLSREDANLGETMREEKRITYYCASARCTIPPNITAHYCCIDECTGGDDVFNRAVRRGLSPLVRFVFSASYGEISQRNCREPKRRRDCHVSSPAARVGIVEKPLRSRNFSRRRSLRETKELEKEREEVEEANAEDDGVLPRKRPRDAPRLNRRKFISRRRCIFPEIGTRQDGWRARVDAIEKLPSLVVTPVHSRLRMQEQAKQTDDVWSTCSGPSTRPRGGAEPSHFRGPQGSAPASAGGSPLLFAIIIVIMRILRRGVLIDRVQRRGVAGDGQAVAFIFADAEQMLGIKTTYPGLNRKSVASPSGETPEPTGAQYPLPDTEQCVCGNVYEFQSKRNV